MSEALATAMQPRVDAPAAATTPESEGSQALASMSNPAHQTGTPPLPILPMLDSPLCHILALFVTGCRVKLEVKTRHIKF